MQADIFQYLCPKFGAFQKNHMETVLISQVEHKSAGHYKSSDLTHNWSTHTRHSRSLRAFSCSRARSSSLVKWRCPPLCVFFRPTKQTSAASAVNNNFCWCWRHVKGLEPIDYLIWRRIKINKQPITLAATIFGQLFQCRCTVSTYRSKFSKGCLFDDPIINDYMIPVRFNHNQLKKISGKENWYGQSRLRLGAEPLNFLVVFVSLYHRIMIIN